MLLNPVSTEAAFVLDSIRQHLMEETVGAAPVPEGTRKPRPAYCRSTSFGSLVADQWSESLPFRADDSDDMVVYGALRDAFSCGWLPDGSFAAVKPEPLPSSLPGLLLRRRRLGVLRFLPGAGAGPVPGHAERGGGRHGRAQEGGGRGGREGQALQRGEAAPVGQVRGGDPGPGQERRPRVARHLRHRRGRRRGLRPRRVPHARLPRAHQLPAPYRLRDRRRPRRGRSRRRQASVARAGDLGLVLALFLLVRVLPEEKEARRGRGRVHGHGPGAAA